MKSFQYIKHCRLLITLFIKDEKGYVIHLAINSLAIPFCFFFFLTKMSSQPNFVIFVHVLPLILAGIMAETGYEILKDRFLGRLVLLRSNGVTPKLYFISRQLLALLNGCSPIVLFIIGFYLLKDANLLYCLIIILACMLACSTLCGISIILGIHAKQFLKGWTQIGIIALLLGVLSPSVFNIGQYSYVGIIISYLSPYTFVSSIFNFFFLYNTLILKACLYLFIQTVIINIFAYKYLTRIFYNDVY